MQKLLVTYFLLLGITFIFYPDGIGVAYRNSLAEHVTGVFPQREANTPPRFGPKGHHYILILRSSKHGG